VLGASTLTLSAIFGSLLHALAKLFELLRVQLAEILRVKLSEFLQEPAVGFHLPLFEPLLGFIKDIQHSLSGCFTHFARILLQVFEGLFGPPQVALQLVELALMHFTKGIGGLNAGVAVPLVLSLVSELVDSLLKHIKVIHINGLLLGEGFGVSLEVFTPQGLNHR
jgi:hypothetical protein